MFITDPNKEKEKEKRKNLSLFSNNFVKDFARATVGPTPSQDFRKPNKLNTFNKLFSWSEVDESRCMKKYSMAQSKYQGSSLKRESSKALQKKWHKIVDLYNLPQKSTETPIRFQNIKTIKRGIEFYRTLAEQKYLQKYPLNINFPQTFLQYSGELKMIHTSRTGRLQCIKIERDEYLAEIKSSIQKQMHKLKQYPSKYKKHYDFEFNQHAPVIVTKNCEDHEINFEVDIENYKIFEERRSKPTSNKIIQRFIYPRNMKAMIFRFCYNKCNKSKEQRQQYYAYRFQNVDQIFRPNKKNSQIFETFKLQSTISATYDRQNKFQYSKITNKNGLQKFIQPSLNLIEFLEKVHKVKINLIYIDYIVDLFDEPWLINIKQVNSMAQEEENSDNSLYISGSYGACRLCSSMYLKRDLSKFISNKMLTQFLEHLRKRMRAAEYDSIEFTKDIIKTRTLNHMTFQICENCYKVVAEEFKLIECERKLAEICNIEQRKQFLINNEGEKSTTNSVMLGNTLRQWRLMIFLVNASNVPLDYLNGSEEIVIKYRLGSTQLIEESWKLKAQQKSTSNCFHNPFSLDMNISKVKIHYFYSENADIDRFLKDTLIHLTISSSLEHRAFAEGSSSILSTFRRRFQNDLCLRQTSSILLFYSNGKYCEITIKVGLICDGEYRISQSTPLTAMNKVYFADRGFTNSNPIPRQWMEAFGINYCETAPSETQYSHLDKQSSKVKKKLQRQPLSKYQ